MKQKWRLVIISSLFLILAACGESNQTTGSDNGDDLVEVTFSEPARILSVAPFYVAIEKGFFEEEGIDAKIASGGGGAQVIATVLSGDAQFAVSGPRSMFAPIEKGEDLVAIQSLNSALTFEIAFSEQYIEEKGLSESMPLEERIAGLSGATIGTNVVGDSGDVYARYLLQLYGLDPSTLETVKLAGNGPKVGGMQEGIVDGGIASPPFSRQAEEQGAGQLMIKASEEPMYANMVWEVVFADRSFLEENHKLTLSVVKAIGKGMDFVRENPDESANLVASYFDGVAVEILEESLVGMSETFQGYGEMNQEAWDNAVDPLVEFSEMSGVNTKLDTVEDGFWTNEYIEEAFSTN